MREFIALKALRTGDGSSFLRAAMYITQWKVKSKFFTQNLVDEIAPWLER